MPNVTRALLITLTVNPQDFRDPESAFEYSRDRIRRMFFQLRKGVSWDGRVYDIDAPYWIKVEFHRSGFAHFHIIFLTRRFVPGRLLNHLWKVGRTNIRRNDSHGISYLLKYVTKGQNLPEWVKERKRLRITQASQGFYEKVGSTKLKKDSEKDCAIPRLASEFRDLTIGERMERWRRLATLKNGERFRQIELPEPFRDILGRILLPIARAGNY